MTFEQYLGQVPGFTDFVAAMPNVWPISMLQDIYAPFGALHLVGLGLMGGAVLLLNLRLMGTDLTGQTLPALEKSTRPWMISGLAIVIGTGIIIGMLNSYKLYTSVPFFVKMMSLIAACIFSFGVTNALAKNEGKASTVTLVALAVAMAFWLLALGVFSTDAISSAGIFHPITGGYALLLIYGVRTRWIAAAAFTLLFGGLFVMYWIVGFDTYEPVFDTVAFSVTIASGLIMAALYAVEIWLGRSDAATPTAKLVALFSVLCWVTVAAGGRWIGFAA
jgi:hypothetical protein